MHVSASINRHGDAALWQTRIPLSLKAWGIDPAVDLLHAELHDLPRGCFGLRNIAVVRCDGDHHVLLGDEHNQRIPHRVRPVVPVHRVWDFLGWFLPDPAACIMVERRCVQQFVSLGGEKLALAKIAAQVFRCVSAEVA